jgi:hypothetical protein
VETRQASNNYEELEEFGSVGDEMVEDVLVGDNIIVLCHSFVDGSFWIMLVDKPLYLVTQHFIDAWGQEWFEGEYVICGLWYERLHQGSKSYYLPKDSLVAFVYSHLIMASKFSMPPTSYVVKGSISTYELFIEILGLIHEGLAS